MRDLASFGRSDLLQLIALKRCYVYITIFLYSYIYGVTLCQFLITVICRKVEFHSQPSSRATARLQCVAVEEAQLDDYFQR